MAEAYAYPITGIAGHCCGMDVQILYCRSGSPIVDIKYASIAGI